jgi:hypothetical protein
VMIAGQVRRVHSRAGTNRQSRQDVSPPSFGTDLTGAGKRSTFDVPTISSRHHPPICFATALPSGSDE